VALEVLGVDDRGGGEDGEDGCQRGGKWGVFHGRVMLVVIVPRACQNLHG
jgi:hypothetical protein